ncbi:MAG: Ig-like domain-containing protein [Patescibacteria group bacterium]
MTSYFTQLPIKKLFFAFALLFFTFSLASSAEAATLSLSPATGVYQANGTFSVRVMVNTNGQAVNAADGTLSFNPRELSVTAVSRSSSIFNLWVTEPTFSNSAGTISFSGGSPTGYTGSAGAIMTITFRAAGAGAPRVSFTGGSVLANDGKGTNVLTAMNGGSYTIQAATIAPTPEVIEYVAPANTPAAPQVVSTTHADTNAWYAQKTAELTWNVPSGVTSVRTLLDQSPSTIPTKVYDEPISSISLPDLPEGASYFHIQFRNADGWGKVTHYKMAVDTEKPISFTIESTENSDLGNPQPTLKLKVVDVTSGIGRYLVKIDAAEPFEFIDKNASNTIALPSLLPGYHTVIIEAFDRAANSLIATYALTIEAFARPVFTEYPTEVSETVIPVIKGKTKPGATVEVSLQKIGNAVSLYTVQSDEHGTFTFIPEARFSLGVYELSAIATDSYGAKSERSEVIRIAVQQSGFIRIGSLLINVLSVVIPLLGLIALLVLGFWLLYLSWRRFRTKVGAESTEALEILHREFNALQQKLREYETSLTETRKTKKLSKVEMAMLEHFDKALQTSEQAVEKEIMDVKKLTDRRK